MREASLKIPVREAVEQQAVAPQPKKVVQSAQKTEAKSVKSVSDVSVKTPQTKQVVNEKKAGDKKLEAAAKPVTKPVRLAKVDPLAPLPAKANSKKTAKDSGSAR